MTDMKKNIKRTAVLSVVLILMFATTVFGAEQTEEYVPAVYATFWALVPPVVAIGLALITKEVYSSLFIGVLMGGILYSGFSFEGTITHIFEDGMINARRHLASLRRIILRDAWARSLRRSCWAV